MCPYIVCPNQSFDVDLIKKGCDALYGLLRDSSIKSGDYDSFVENYSKKTKSLLSKISTINEYMCVRLAAEICLSSFEYWSVYFLETSNVPQKKKESLK